jgi:hypothetical protein
MHPIKNPATVKRKCKTAQEKFVEMFQKIAEKYFFSEEGIYICTV